MDERHRKQGLKILELFSGIGGMRYALSFAGVIADEHVAVDVDQLANRVYHHNFSGHAPVAKDVTTLPHSFFAGFDVWSMSPPCQPYTQQTTAKQRDVHDHRAAALSYLAEVITGLQSHLLPQFVVVENVKNFAVSVSWAEFSAALKLRNFAIRTFLLSPRDVGGFPNERLRFFAVAELRSSNTSGRTGEIGKQRQRKKEEEDRKVEVNHEEKKGEPPPQQAIPPAAKRRQCIQPPPPQPADDQHQHHKQEVPEDTLPRVVSFDDACLENDIPPAHDGDDTPCHEMMKYRIPSLWTFLDHYDCCDGHSTAAAEQRGPKFYGGPSRGGTPSLSGSMEVSTSTAAHRLSIPDSVLRKSAAICFDIVKPRHDDCCTAADIRPDAATVPVITIPGSSQQDSDKTQRWQSHGTSQIDPNDKNDDRTDDGLRHHAANSIDSSTWRFRSYTLCFTKSYGRYIDGTGSVLLLTEESELDLTRHMLRDISRRTTTAAAAANNAFGVAVGGSVTSPEQQPQSATGSVRQDEFLMSEFSGQLRYFSPMEIARLQGFKMKCSSAGEGEGKGSAACGGGVRRNGQWCNLLWCIDHHHSAKSPCLPVRGCSACRGFCKSSQRSEEHDQVMTYDNNEEANTQRPLPCKCLCLDFPSDISLRRQWALLGNSLNPQVVGLLLLACGIPEVLLRVKESEQDKVLPNSCE